MAEALRLLESGAGHKPGPSGEAAAQSFAAAESVVRRIVAAAVIRSNHFKVLARIQQNYVA